ncbi:MAG: hypothetical protein ACK47B_22655 [Armatimonadota bacterium]
MRRSDSINWIQRLQDHFYGAVDRFDAWSQPFVSRLSGRIDSLQAWWGSRRRAL